MSIKVHHISIFICDMERTIFLFQDILGFKLTWHIPAAKGKKLSALMGIPDLECELAYLTSADNDVAIELSRLINPVIKIELSNRRAQMAFTRISLFFFITAHYSFL